MKEEKTTQEPSEIAYIVTWVLIITIWLLIGKVGGWYPEMPWWEILVPVGGFAALLLLNLIGNTLVFLVDKAIKKMTK